MNEEGLKEHVLGLEYELLSPQVRRSDARLGELLADEFLEFGASGRIYDKQSTIHSLMQSEATESFQVDDFRLVTSSEDMVFVTYSCAARSASGEVIRKSIRSSLWKLAGGCWRIVFHQGTRTG
jgi:hypothetical protein